MTKFSDGQEKDPSYESAVVLALCYSGHSLGASVYYQATKSIHLLHDLAEDTEFRHVLSLLNQTDPSVILVNRSQDLGLIRLINDIAGVEVLEVDKEDDSRVTEDASKEVENGEETREDESEIVPSSQFDPDSNGKSPNDEEEDEKKEIEVHQLPSGAFSYENAKARIAQLFAAECFSRSENSTVVHFRVDMNSSNMVRSIGALFKFMDAIRLGVEYESLNVQTPVESMKTLILENMLEIDKTTYRALEIFSDLRQEISWKKAMQGNRSASIFSLCNRCRSTPGRNMLRKWFEHPTQNRETIASRQKAVSFFAQDCNMDTTTVIHQHLGQIRSLRTILKLLRSGACRVSHWESLYRTMLNLVAIGKCLRERDVRLKLMKDHSRFFDDKLAEITAVVAELCDFEESRLENRLVVRLGIDTDLDETKHIYRQLPKILTNVAREEAEELQAETCSVGYVPMVGYLLQLPANYPVDSNPSLQKIYMSGNEIHVKSDRMNRLDEELGDLKMQIIDKESTIMLRLKDMILKKADILLGACQGAALLDAALALAMTARSLGWSCPTMVDEPGIVAVQSFHPLAQISAVNKKFVANPIECGNRNTNIQIFTGPNACGKSVYLKQVGVVAFLAHIGSFVPAQRVHIGPINRIMTRMYTVDGVLDGMSTFAIDLSQLGRALRRGNEKSLVIIDEFGKGTMTEVGLSLLSSSLNYFINKGKAKCPLVFVSSHFHALPKLINMDESIVSYHTLEVVKVGPVLDFKFRLIDGLVGTSFASYTARKMKISDDVVERSEQVYEILKEGTALADIPAIPGEENKCQWLEEQMTDFLDEYKSWDLENNFQSFMERLEQVFVRDDETVTSWKNPEKSTNEQEEGDNQKEEHDDHNEDSVPEEDVFSKEVLDQLNTSQVRDQSILKSESSKNLLDSSRNPKNLSVSFLLGKDNCDKRNVTFVETSVSRIGPHSPTNSNSSQQEDELPNLTESVLKTPIKPMDQTQIESPIVQTNPLKKKLENSVPLPQRKRLRSC